MLTPDQVRERVAALCNCLPDGTGLPPGICGAYHIDNTWKLLRLEDGKLTVAGTMPVREDSRLTWIGAHPSGCCVHRGGICSCGVDMNRPATRDQANARPPSCPPTLGNCAVVFNACCGPYGTPEAPR